MLVRFNWLLHAGLRISQPDFSNSTYAHSFQALDANRGPANYKQWKKKKKKSMAYKMTPHLSFHTRQNTKITTSLRKRNGRLPLTDPVVPSVTVVFFKKTNKINKQLKRYKYILYKKKKL